MVWFKPAARRRRWAVLAVLGALSGAALPSPGTSYSATWPAGGAAGGLATAAAPVVVLDPSLAPASATTSTTSALAATVVAGPVAVLPADRGLASPPAAPSATSSSPAAAGTTATFPLAASAGRHQPPAPAATTTTTTGMAGVAAEEQRLVRALRARLNGLAASSAEARWLLADGDWTLYRFLVSRDFDLDQAEAMFREAVQWRTASGIRRELDAWRAGRAALVSEGAVGGGPRRGGLDALAARSSSSSGNATGAVADLERAAREAALADTHFYATAHFGEVPGTGEPVNVELLGRLDVAGVKRVPGMSALVVKAYLLHLEETFQATREASLRRGGFVRCRVVVDAAGLGLGSAKDAVQLLQTVASIGQRYYPELVHSIAVVRAPLVFTAVWAAARWILSPRVQAKVQVLGGNFLDELEAAGVPRETLPRLLGGTADDAGLRIPRPVPKHVDLPPDLEAFLDATGAAAGQAAAGRGGASSGDASMSTSHVWS